MIQPGRVDAKFFLVSIALGAAILLFDLSLPRGVAGGVITRGGWARLVREVPGPTTRFVPA